MKLEAQGKASAALVQAEGDAKVRQLNAEAEANAIRKVADAKVYEVQKAAESPSLYFQLEVAGNRGPEVEAVGRQVSVLPDADGAACGFAQHAADPAAGVAHGHPQRGPAGREEMTARRRNYRIM